MMALSIGTVGKFAVAIAGILLAAVTSFAYQSPAMGVLLESFRFCG